VSTGLEDNCLKRKENFFELDDIALAADCKSRARVTLPFGLLGSLVDGAVRSHLGFLRLLTGAFRRRRCHKR